MLCEACGKPCERRNQVQRYCRACSAIKNQERKTRWGREHAKPVPPEVRAKRLAARAARMRQVGETLTEPSSISWMADRPEPSLAWFVRVAVPFSYRMSKNAIWSNSGRGHVFLRAEARSHRHALSASIRAAMGDREIKQNRVWLDVLVEKPDHKGDAVNVVDLVCDAAKDAIGLDDRWFSIRRLDWSVVKKEPRLFVGLGQEAVEDVIVCGYCGRMLPVERFSKHAGNPLGRARVCQECRVIERKATRAEARP